MENFADAIAKCFISLYSENDEAYRLTIESFYAAMTMASTSTLSDDCARAVYEYLNCKIGFFSQGTVRFMEENTKDNALQFGFTQKQRESIRKVADFAKQLGKIYEKLESQRVDPHAIKQVFIYASSEGHPDWKIAEELHIPTIRVKCLQAFAEVIENIFPATYYAEIAI